MKNTSGGAFCSARAGFLKGLRAKIAGPAIKTRPYALAPVVKKELLKQLVLVASWTLESTMLISKRRLCLMVMDAPGLPRAAANIKLAGWVGRKHWSDWPIQNERSGYSATWSLFTAISI
jgi:hypothetical protein